MVSHSLYKMRYCTRLTIYGHDPQQMTLLFQIDSDTKNCNMMWGDLGMLYFCIGNEDLKNRRLKTHVVYYKLVNEKVVLVKRTTFYNAKYA